MPAQRSSAWLVAVVASLLLHLAWGSQLTRRSRQVVSGSEPIEFSVESPAPTPDAHEPPPAQPVPPVPSSEARAAAPRRISAVAPRARQPETPAAESSARRAPVSAAQSPPSAADSSARAEVEQPGAQVDLSPQAVARAWQPVLAARSCSPTSSAGHDRCPNEPAVSAEAAAQKQLDQAMRTAAAARPYLAPREPPALQHHSDGSYAYVGHVFAARIAKDGQVEFSDKLAGVASIPVSGHFDLSDTIEKYALKNDVYAAEKRWFLDQTEALRNQLADTARAAELLQAQRAIGLELERVLARDQSASTKKAAVFALWLDCGDDRDAAAVRGVVEAFIRGHMPQGSELGYDAADLVERNRGRPAAFRFDPYRV